MRHCFLDLWIVIKEISSMDEILVNPRPRVNAELLPKFQGKNVTVLGNAGANKMMNGRKVLTVMDGAGSSIQVYLGTSLKGTERLEGLIEAVGAVDENNYVHAQLYREFKPDTEMGRIFVRLLLTMRKLKYHEKKLLKKVDFIDWEADNNIHEIKIMRKYRILKREDYTAYNKLSRQIRNIARKLRDLESEDPFRTRSTKTFINKLYRMGLIPTKETLALADKVSASSFCRRRLPVILVRLKMSQNLKMATTLIEQGHVRVGTDVVTDPAYFVTRSMQDFITWKETSKIKKHINEYNDERDDFDFA